GIGRAAERGGGGRRVNDLGQRAAARVEVAVPAIAGRDAVAGGAQRAGGEGRSEERRAGRQRGSPKRARAVDECDRARRRAGTRGSHADGRGVRQCLAGDRGIGRAAERGGGGRRVDNLGQRAAARVEVAVTAIADRDAVAGGAQRAGGEG